jgi:hypothetical protein
MCETRGVSHPETGGTRMAGGDLHPPTLPPSRQYRQPRRTRPTSGVLEAPVAKLQPVQGIKPPPTLLVHYTEALYTDDIGAAFNFHR